MQSSHKDERLPLQEHALYDTMLPDASSSFSFSSRETKKPQSYGAVPEAPFIGQSNSYELSVSSGSTEANINNPALRANQNGIKIQQQSINPPPLPPSRRRTHSGEQYFHRSESGEYESGALSPRHGNGHTNFFVVPPKAPPRQQSPRNTYTGSIAGTGKNSNHRRTHSLDSRKLRRESSSNSLVSLNSQGSGYSQRSISESIKLLPDPRWGGGSGGRTNRARTVSGGSQERGHRKVDSFSSHDGLILSNGGGHYGSVTSKNVIMHGLNNSFELSGGNHRRTPSEVSATSFMSAASIDTSVEPARVDPAKSSMFKEVASGLVRLQLPKDNFRLLSDRDLESGYVYKRQLVANEAEYFQDFHTVENGDIPLQTASGCNCLCDNCNHCYSRRKSLPPTYYVMSVKPDIYRRMLDEVSESKSMPCGLFFCGHHEDVRYPSIMIAVALVTILFLLLLSAMFYVKD